MAQLIDIADLRSGYVEVINTILSRGVRVAPRGQGTIELNDAVIVLHDPEDALPIGTGRKVSTVVAAIESIQLISGVDMTPNLEAIAPAFTKYVEEDGTAWGNYGTRVGSQIWSVQEKLLSDAHTRQAVIVLWDRFKDNIPGKRDYPCTVALHFKLREDTLFLTTFMRSNDAWLGLAQDAFVFTQLQLTLARSLNVPAGRYTHIASSLHLYERDRSRIEQLHLPRESRSYMPSGVGVTPTSFENVQERARRIVRNDLGDPSRSELWYIGKIHGA
jgi:thymidylate synthase